MVKSSRSSNEWVPLLEDFFASGLSTKDWCKKHNIERNQLRYRIERSNKKSNNEHSTEFVGVSVNKEIVPCSIVIHVGDAAITVNPGFSKALLCEVVSALSDLC